MRAMPSAEAVSSRWPAVSIMAAVDVRLPVRQPGLLAACAGVPEAHRIVVVGGDDLRVVVRRTPPMRKSKASPKKRRTASPERASQIDSRLVARCGDDVGALAVPVGRVDDDACADAERRCVQHAGLAFHVPDAGLVRRTRQWRRAAVRAPAWRSPSRQGRGAQSARSASRCAAAGRRSWHRRSAPGRRAEAVRMRLPSGL